MSNLLGIDHLKDKKIAILGLGREGLSTFNFLKKQGVKSDVLDYKLDKDYLKKLGKYGMIFRTPGFPRLHPKLLAAEKRGAIVTSHTKLFFALCPGKIIGITGTKGKTTTASLIYRILKSKYGKSVFIAGNIGKPALDILAHLKKNSLVILELSSFQLQDLSKSPQVAVITNITLDHMDPSGKFLPSTHQTPKEYFNAKMNIIKHQKKVDFAVLHQSLKNKIKNLGKGKKIFPNPLPPIGGLETKLKGNHNLENISLAVEVGKIFKVPPKNILRAVKNFKGVEHRLEFVAKINGISFYNDSAATNPDATLAALKSFKEPVHPVRGREGPQRASASNGVHLILGGSDKSLNYTKLIKYIIKSENIKTVILIGQIKNKLYKLLTNSKKRQRFPATHGNLRRAIAKSELNIKKVKTLKDAVLTLYKNAGKNEVVLLSPAAASFDMFQNYAQRGDEFKQLVKRLPLFFMKHH